MKFQTPLIIWAAISMCFTSCERKQEVIIRPEAIEEIAKNKVADLADEFAESAQAADLATRRAQALKTGIEDVIEAKNRLALAQLNKRAKDRENATAAGLKAEIDFPIQQAKPSSDPNLPAGVEPASKVDGVIELGE